MRLRSSEASARKPPQIHQPISEFTEYPVQTNTTMVITDLTLCDQLKAGVALQAPVTPCDWLSYFAFRCWDQTTQRGKG